MRKKNKDPEFWVTNISTKKDISLSDLRVTIRRGRSVNLLDKRHYHFTPEQLEKSLESGSIKSRSHVIKIRKVAPEPRANKIDIVYKRRLLVPAARNVVTIDSSYNEELDYDDENDAEEAYAAEAAEAELSDQAPRLAVDPKFRKIVEDD